MCASFKKISQNVRFNDSVSPLIHTRNAYNVSLLQYLNLIWAILFVLIAYILQKETKILFVINANSLLAIVLF